MKPAEQVPFALVSIHTEIAQFILGFSICRSIKSAVTNWAPARHLFYFCAKHRFHFQLWLCFTHNSCSHHSVLCSICAVVGQHTNRLSREKRCEHFCIDKHVSDSEISIAFLRFRWNSFEPRESQKKREELMRGKETKYWRQFILLINQATIDLCYNVRSSHSFKLNYSVIWDEIESELNELSQLLSRFSAEKFMDSDANYWFPSVCHQLHLWHIKVVIVMVVITYFSICQSDEPTPTVCILYEFRMRSYGFARLQSSVLK